jgi:hypothetical protein
MLDLINETIRNTTKKIYKFYPQHFNSKTGMYKLLPKGFVLAEQIKLTALPLITPF